MDEWKLTPEESKQLRTLYNDYMKYKHAKNDTERQEALKTLLEVHKFNINNILNNNK